MVGAGAEGWRPVSEGAGERYVAFRATMFFPSRLVWYMRSSAAAIIRSTLVGGAAAGRPLDGIETESGRAAVERRKEKDCRSSRPARLPGLHGRYNHADDRGPPPLPYPPVINAPPLFRRATAEN
jgi:hypothetical protein